MTGQLSPSLWGGSRAILLPGSELAGDRLSCDSFGWVYAKRDVVEEGVRERPPSAQQQTEPAPFPSVPKSPERVSPASLARLQRLVGNQAVCRFLSTPARPAIDVLTTEEGEDATDGDILDRMKIARQPGGGGATATAASDAGAPAATAVPTNLRQIVTSWTPGSTKYGFQVKFQCSSSSGSVADLQAQPNLVWREYVTYSRNDFAHRISPPDPTIMPPGGVSFSAATTTVLGTNLLEFNSTRDTHWMPTSAIRAGDFKPLGTRDLPGVMRSSQLYQFSTNNSTWTNFAGPFSLTRTLERASGPPGPDGSVPLVFTTEKAGIHTVTEIYKP